MCFILKMTFYFKLIFYLAIVIEIALICLLRLKKKVLEFIKRRINEGVQEDAGTVGVGFFCK